MAPCIQNLRDDPRLQSLAVAAIVVLSILLPACSGDGSPSTPTAPVVEAIVTLCLYDASTTSYNETGQSLGRNRDALTGLGVEYRRVSAGAGSRITGETDAVGCLTDLSDRPDEPIRITGEDGYLAESFTLRQLDNATPDYFDEAADRYYFFGIPDDADFLETFSIFRQGGNESNTIRGYKRGGKWDSRVVTEEDVDGVSAVLQPLWNSVRPIDINVLRNGRAIHDPNANENEEGVVRYERGVASSIFPGPVIDKGLVYYTMFQNNILPGTVAHETAHGFGNVQHLPTGVYAKQAKATIATLLEARAARAATNRSGTTFPQ